MSKPARGTEGSQPGRSTVSLGSGWVLPAIFIALLVSLIYLPGHHASAGAPAGDGSMAAAAALYLVAMSVVIPRLVRGWILRRAGSQEPIALLGGGDDPLVIAAIRSSRRLAAIAAGIIVSAAAALGSAAVFGVADPTSYSHALAGLTLATNLALVVTAAVPMPGLTGWALLLALVDAGGVPADQRTRRAARIAQVILVPGFILVGIGAALLTHPMMILIGFLLAMSTRMLTESAVGHDAIARFLGCRDAGDVARPVTSHADADESVDDLVGRLADGGAVTLVESREALVGAIGPRQLDARDRVGGGQRCADLMVPLGDLLMLPATTPATTLMAALGRDGLVLVRGSGGLTYVEAGDLLRQILASTGADRRTGGVEGRDSVGRIRP